MLTVEDQERAAEAVKTLRAHFGFWRVRNAMLEERGVLRLYQVPQNEWPQFVRRIAERLTGRKIP